MADNQSESYGCWTKNRAILIPKMDGWFHGKPYEQMDDLGGFHHPYFWFNTHIGKWLVRNPPGFSGPKWTNDRGLAVQLRNKCLCWILMDSRYKATWKVVQPQSPWVNPSIFDQKNTPWILSSVKKSQLFKAIPNLSTKKTSKKTLINIGYGPLTGCHRGKWRFSSWDSRKKKWFIILVVTFTVRGPHPSHIYIYNMCIYI